MSTFILRSNEGVTADEQAFLDRHRAILDAYGTHDVGATALNSARRVKSMYDSVPTSVKWVLLALGLLLAVAVVPLFLIAIVQAFRNAECFRRLLQTLVVGGFGVGGLVVLYLLLAFL